MAPAAEASPGSTPAAPSASARAAPAPSPARLLRRRRHRADRHRREPGARLPLTRGRSSGAASGSTSTWPRPGDRGAHRRPAGPRPARGRRRDRSSGRRQHGRRDPRAVARRAASIPGTRAGGRRRRRRHPCLRPGPSARHPPSVRTQGGRHVLLVRHDGDRRAPRLRPYAPAISSNLDLPTLDGVFGELEETARARLWADGFTDDQIELRRYADARYPGQVHELTISMPSVAAYDERIVAEIEQHFHAEHERHFAYRGPTCRSSFCTGGSARSARTAWSSPSPRLRSRPTRDLR